MSKTLIIAEKPSVAADIAKVVKADKQTQTAYVGDQHIVSWAVGHLLEFVPPEGYDDSLKRWRLKDLPIIPDSFRIEPVKGSKRQLNALKKYLNQKDVQKVVNACDAGREGELIFREIYRWSGTDKPVDRLWLQSMTAQAIAESLADARPEDAVQGLADAADCRAESDWLIGMNATRALTIRLRSGRDRNVWSAGRVQTATLALLARRELEILDHEPEPYWLIKARFAVDEPGHEYEASWWNPAAETHKDRVTDPAQRDRILALLTEGAPARITETRKVSRESSPPLFDLTTLQREANKRFGYAARTTLRAAQALYEQHKLITYPRTDSRALPSDYREHVQSALQFLAADKAYAQHAERLIADGLENTARNFDDSAVSDHFAIVPTGEGSPKGLRAEQKKVWDLIVRRFLAAFHPVAEWAEVERLTTVEEDTFRTRRRVLKTAGWRAVFEREAGDEASTLPPVDDGTPATVAGAEAEAKETRPPPRFTEATLLGLMETAGKEIDDAELARVLKETGGLGTPATRAEIIETLLGREYAERVTGLDGRRALRATARGLRLIDALQRIQLPRLTSPELTASLETALRDVEHGADSRLRYMDEVRSWTREIVERIRDFSYDTLYENEESLGTCPRTQQPVRETLRTYSCAQGPREGVDSLVIWKEISGRYIDRKSAAQILRDGTTPLKAGFFTRDGREYEATLRLVDDGRVEVVPKGREEPEDAPVPVEPADVGPCPFHPELTVRRSSLGYRCDGFADPSATPDGKKCKLNLPLQVCKRDLQVDEAEAMIGAERKTQVIDGFISKRGRPFSATLHLTDQGRLRFEFPPRGTRPGVELKKFPVDPEPLCKDPLTPGAQIVESETEFVSTDNGGKIHVPREICQRELTRREAKALFEDGETDVLEGFISKAGKPFNAKLYLRKNGRHGFRFAK